MVDAWKYIGKVALCARIMIALPPGEIEADLILNF